MDAYQEQNWTHRQAYEVCRQLLIDLSIERNKQRPDIDKMAWLRKEITAYPSDMVKRAFDEVVDHQGW